MVVLTASPGPSVDEGEGSLTGRLRSIFITGAALAIPLIVTIIVLVFVLNFILNLISPLVFFLKDALGIGQNIPPYVLEMLAILVLLLLIFLVGVVAELRSGEGLEQAFDTAMARIPGVGSVYTSFNEMSELLLSNDTQSFREVKLVEFPTQGSYSVGFVTADPPATFSNATGNDEMTTLFVPLAPNPVMGGFVLHVSTDRIYDVDISVEEGIRSIVTSGVATGETDDLTHDGELIDLAALRKQAIDGVEDISEWGSRTADDITDLSELSRADLETLTMDTWRDVAEMQPAAEDAGQEADTEQLRHYMLEEDVIEDLEPGSDSDTDDEQAESDSGPTSDQSSRDGSEFDGETE